MPEKKNRRLALNLTESEAQLLLVEAEATGQTISQIVRSALVGRRQISDLMRNGVQFAETDRQGRPTSIRPMFYDGGEVGKWYYLMTFGRSRNPQASETVSNDGNGSAE